MNKFRVLVLCTGNSARSQIAEALFTARGGSRIDAQSAGSHPAARVNPGAIAVLREHGIAWEGRQPHHMDHVANEQFDLVITVCDEARDACPVFPGATARVHWGIADPARELDPVRAREAFEATFDVLSARIDSFLTLPFEGMERAQLAHAAQQIHDVT